VQVWSVRVDVTILDHCGNLVDAAMVAATTALRAFRRPDVSVSGEDVTIVCTVLYCTVLYCTVLYCTVLYLTVPYCTVL
jgi:exosome complex RNA-binding protein Rrp42 (RNase PH superfamily)